MELKDNMIIGTKVKADIQHRLLKYKSNIIPFNDIERYNYVENKFIQKGDTVVKGIYIEIFLKSNNNLKPLEIVLFKLPGNQGYKYGSWMVQSNKKNAKQIMNFLDTIINENKTLDTSREGSKISKGTAEELLLYKNLLDQEVITQDEFNKQKDLLFNEKTEYHEYEDTPHDESCKESKKSKKRLILSVIAVLFLFSLFGEFISVFQKELNTNNVTEQQSKFLLNFNLPEDITIDEIKKTHKISSEDKWNYSKGDGVKYLITELDEETKYGTVCYKFYNNKLARITLLGENNSIPYGKDILENINLDADDFQEYINTGVATRWQSSGPIIDAWVVLDDLSSSSDKVDTIHITYRNGKFFL